MRHEVANCGRTLFHTRHRLRGREAGLFSTAVRSHSGHVCSEATCNFLQTRQRFARPGSARTRSEAFSGAFSFHRPATRPKASAETGQHIGKSDHSAPTHNNVWQSQSQEPGRPVTAGPRFVTNAILRSGWPADSAATAPFPVGRTSAVLPSERFACDHRQPVPQ